ncbi:DNA adenine methylase [Larkinella insperata]|uniref:site-specific DNA-methyltransferase (adenine-specific) n=1 Tax=Larkinella insperata TaxID=332158 RepID=A0ABW3QA37_9BACT|nr:DNA adenine methylase [Larkinella insperata]
MILTRMGNKRAIAARIQSYFPEHDLYLEPFFGAGGMFFSKPKVKYNVVNDADEEVYNLFHVVQHQLAELEAFWRMAPQHDKLFQHWKTHSETDPVLKAARFLYLSNYGFMGRPTSMKMGIDNTKFTTYNRLPACAQALEDVIFASTDFRKFFKQFALPARLTRAFCYADPPYLDTDNTYAGGKRSTWTKQDLVDLLDALESRQIPFAMSEFDHPFVLAEASRRGLFVHEIGERRNLSNRRMEILLTNYEKRE